MFPLASSITTSFVENLFCINISSPLTLFKIPAQKLMEKPIIEKTRLEKLATIHEMKLFFNDKNSNLSDFGNDKSINGHLKSVMNTAKNSILTAHSEQTKVILVSPYSPFYLHKNNVLNQINIYNIYMKTNSDNSATWVIKGDFSND